MLNSIIGEILSPTRAKTSWQLLIHKPFPHILSLVRDTEIWLNWSRTTASNLRCIRYPGLWSQSTISGDRKQGCGGEGEMEGWREERSGNESGRGGGIPTLAIHCWEWFTVKTLGLLELHLIRCLSCISVTKEWYQLGFLESSLRSPVWMNVKHVLVKGYHHRF